MASGTLVDANVLLDVLTEDPAWLTWSQDALAEATDAGSLLTRGAARFRTYFPTVRLTAPAR
ncbi:MAG TPA: hypothetical protein VFM27_07480 [Acidimicrobiales bacterium]|nr:hypothetical protein [Acidimicrobiales bacterium]